MDFGPKLGVKLEPSWHRNRRKWGTKTMSKNHQKSRAARVRSGTQMVRSGPGSWPLGDPSGIEYWSTRGKLTALGTLPLGHKARGRIYIHIYGNLQTTIYIYHLLFAIFHLSFTMYYLPFVICQLKLPTLPKHTYVWAQGPGLGPKHVRTVL